MSVPNRIPPPPVRFSPPRPQPAAARVAQAKAAPAVAPPPVYFPHRPAGPASGFAQAKPAAPPVRPVVAPPPVYSPHQAPHQAPRQASPAVQAKARYLAPPPVRFPVPPPAPPPPPVRFHQQAQAVQAKPAGIAPPPLRFPGQQGPAPAPAAATPATAAQPQKLRGLRRRLAAPGPFARPKASKARAGSHGCGCSRCSQAKMLWRPGAAIQRSVIQRSDDDSDYMEESDVETDCDDTDYADPDDDCEVYPQYNIRNTFYPGGYWAATLLWKAARILALQNGCPVGQFECPECDACILAGNGTIDHVYPVVQHWNATGHNQTQAQRAAWYNNTANMEVVCGPCNSGMGGGAVYDRQVGPGFAGPGEG